MMRTTRRVTQIFFLLFFLFLFLKARYPYSDALSSDLFLRFSPLAAVFDFIQNLHFPILFWPALIIIILTPFWGRFFCGWICPLGTTLDMTDHLLKTTDKRTAVGWTKWRYLKYAVLLGLILLAVFGIHLWGFLDPLSLFNRTLTVALYPLTTLFLERSLLFLGEMPLAGDAFYRIYDLFKDLIMPEEQAFLQQVFWIALFFVLILALEKLSRRFWCRNLCPLGALLGFLSQFRFFGRKVADSCTSCAFCHSECKMNAIPADNPLDTHAAECIQCFNCAENCPEKISAVSYGWQIKPQRSAIDFERRRFLQTTTASAAVLGLMNIGLANKNEQALLIRPPGAIPEDDFLDRCIHCLQCVRICSSNGGCLQADQIHFDIRQLWSPVAKMREGWCEYNCNLCGLVCPTQAILPLPLEIKKKTNMGLARFDKNACIPFERNEDCIVCEEHCPVADKAIKFELKEVVQEDGTLKMVKYPYVIRELCIGCGICETKCPLPGMPGIYITTENQTRLTAVEGAV